MNHPTALEKCIIDYMKEIIELNFYKEKIDIKYHINDNLFKFYINFKNGMIVIELDNDEPDMLYIYAKITNSKILGMLDMGMHDEIYNKGISMTFQTLMDDGWVDILFEAHSAIEKKVKMAGI